MNPANLDSQSSETLNAQSLHALYQLAKRAGDAILEIYQDEDLWHSADKADDTPVTAADLRSSEILVAGLPEIVSCPVVSEEALPAYEERRDWQRYWLVDPMDGTREFLHKTDEFVINIALMADHQPVFGLIYQPITGEAWWGGKGYGAFRGTPDQAQALTIQPDRQRLVALGSRRSKWKGAWKQRLTDAGYQCEQHSLGSALKFTRLADGRGDIYPRLGPTSEWDTAAPQAILDVTGGAIRQWDGSPLQYGKRNMLNPHFVAVRQIGLLDVVLDEGAD